MAIEISNEQKQRFIDLVCALSPENLSCDGELSYRQVREREASLRSQWETLEIEVGRSVSEDEVYDWLREPVPRSMLVKGA